MTSVSELIQNIKHSFFFPALRYLVFPFPNSHIHPTHRTSPNQTTRINPIQSHPTSPHHDHHRKHHQTQTTNRDISQVSTQVPNLTTKMARGKLIVFEGLDRAGKSTQCAMLAQALQEAGHSVRLMRFPGEYVSILKECSVVEGGISIGNFSDIAMTDRTTPIGQMINSYLSGQSEAEDHVIHLLFSANRWEAVYVYLDIGYLCWC
jgi:ATPase subunit of ABC transporter with duplicated ATPase domains